MTRLPLAGALGMALACAASARANDDSEVLLEQGARCLRRGDFACAEARSRDLLAAPDLPPSLAREALALAVAALAALDRPTEAAEACARLKALWPAYSPPPDADPRVALACANPAEPPPPSGPAPTAHRPEITPTSPGPAPAAPAPHPEANPAPPEPAPSPEATPAAVAVKAPVGVSISLGGGPGVPLGASADRFETGIHAALDLQFALNPCGSVWTQATLALLRLSPSLPLEPSQGTTLTAFTATIGATYRLDLGAIDLVAGLGVGLGGFGFGRVDDGLGLALSPLVGVRHALNRNLGVRLDFAPVAVLPFAPALSLAGHLAVVLRADAAF